MLKLAPQIFSVGVVHVLVEQVVVAAIQSHQRKERTEPSQGLENVVLHFLLLEVLSINQVIRLEDVQVILRSEFGGQGFACKELP